MTEESQSFPQRPHTHVVGGSALNSFNYRRPQEWNITESTLDYGWDLLVEIPEDGRMKGLAFSIQLKGTDSPKFVDDNSQISFPLDVSTVEFLLGKLEPPMIVVCHTSDPEEPVFWVWLREAVEAVESGNPLWKKQSTVSIRIPTNSKLTRSVGSVIRDYVRRYYDLIRIGQKVSEFLTLESDSSESPGLTSYRGQPERFVNERLLPHLGAAGLVDTFATARGETTKALSPEDQSRYVILKDAGQLLGKLRDREAEQLLDKIGSAIDSAADGIKARYWNCRGVLALHQGRDSEALACYTKALDLRPYDHKYLSNCLFLQFHMHRKSSVSAMQVEWVEQLESLIRERPDFSPPVRLKAFWLSEMEGPEVAEAYLSASPVWERDKVDMRLCAAEIYKDAGNNQKALSILEEAEPLVDTVNATYVGLKAHILMRLALNDTSTADGLLLHGYGPKKLDLKYLRRSFDTYVKALAIYREAGFPLISEFAITNFAAVAGLLNKPEAAEQACRQFLESHPDNQPVSAAIAASFVYHGRPLEAVTILKKLHQLQPESSTHFKNLILSQLLAEEYEDLALTVQTREGTGFWDVEEEGVARSMLAVALAELGEQPKARDQIGMLKGKPELSAKAFVAEADIVWRTTRDRSQVLQVYKTGLAMHSDDPLLQTMFAMQVGTSTPEFAKEAVPILVSLENTRQLAPEEYLLLVRGHLVLDQPERAAEVLERALARYPEDHRFVFEHSSVQWRLGNEEAAYHSIQEYLKREKSYHALRECAVLARNTGRLKEAIKLFELASRKATTLEEKGSIHSQLFILKKLRGDATKEILRHVHEFGLTTDKNPEKDAQYFMMFLTAPGEVDPNDPEITTWCSEAQRRIQEFSVLHPQFHSFRAFKIDATRSIVDQFKDMISDIIAKTLSYELATTPLRMAARSQSWPLVLRAKYYPQIESVFHLWSKCVKSKEFEYGIHIWNNENNPTTELAALERAREVCIDITGLLTLAELNLLDTFSSKFERIYLAPRTKRVLAVQQVSLDGPHPLAASIEKWRIANISKIRFRAAGPSKAKPTPEITDGQGTVVLPAKETLSIDKLLGDGVGESLLLSKRLGVPLYSDESSVRIWAASDYGIEAFCTLTFLNFLRHSTALSEKKSIALQAEMIKRNFRTIPFGARHLIEPLKELVREKGADITYAQLREHPVLSVYLDEFVESKVTIESLAQVATDWWFAIVFDKELPIASLPACLEGPSRALILWRTFSGVIEKVENEPEKRAAALWAGFLWRCYRRDDGELECAWKNIKECCSCIFPEQVGKQRSVLFQHIPKFLCQIVSQDLGLTLNQKLTLYVSFPWKLPPGDPDRIELEKSFVPYSRKLSR